MKKFTFILIALSAMIALQLHAQVSLNIKVYLEGPFNGTDMSTDLNLAGLIPLTQPYNVAPWNYPGTEQVSSIPNPDIVDWILVELRQTTGGASTATSDKMIYRQAAFLKTDGSIVGLDGISLITYSGTITGNLFFVIHHRNHLPVMSSTPAMLIGSTYSWDFTDQLTKAYLNGHKQLSAGVYGMIAGDCNADKIVSAEDIDPDWSGDAGRQGYYSGDVNLDSQVNNPDKNEIWLPNLGGTAKLPWECNSPFTDERDDQIYNTIQIGTQCWMAENLNIGTMIPGLDAMFNNGVIEKYCYNNDPLNCNIYGGLYQWNEMMYYSTQQGIQGICPAGWYLPTDDEWAILGDFLGGGNIAGGKMKTTGTIEAGTGLWYAPNSGATNLSGFTGLPGGQRNIAGIFVSLGNNALFWSSTGSYDTAWCRMLSYNVPSMGRAGNYMVYGFSVRCLKD